MRRSQFGLGRYMLVQLLFALTATMGITLTLARLTGTTARSISMAEFSSERDHGSMDFVAGAFMDGETMIVATMVATLIAMSVHSAMIADSEMAAASEVTSMDENSMAVNRAAVHSVAVNPTAGDRAVEVDSAAAGPMEVVAADLMVAGAGKVAN